MHRVRLSDEQQEELVRRTRQKSLARRTRDRLEMVRLSHSGMSIPKIAKHLHVSEIRVRHWIKVFLSLGWDALPDQPHRGRPPTLTPKVLDAVRQEVKKGERTWSGPQLLDWIEEQFGVQVSLCHLRVRLRQEKLRYKRTSRSLRHKQKPEEVEAKRKELDDLAKRGTRA